MMVRPVLTSLQVDNLPALNEALFRSPSYCLVSPRPCQAFLHPPTDNTTPHLHSHPHSAEASLRRSRYINPLHKSAHPPISPSTPSTLRGPSPRAAGRHDHMVQAASSVPTFYEVLGLADDVAIPDIKSAYRQMARKYHPDVCPDSKIEESTRRFIAVQEAYETLSDPARRASYDRTMSSGAAARWGWASEKEAPMDWKYRWEDQLFNMQQKSAAKAAEGSSSWGARMRKQRQEQQQDHEYAGF